MAASSFLQRAWRQQTAALISKSHQQTRHLSLSPQRQKQVHESPTAKLKRSFQLLGLDQEECTEQEVRKAYIKLAKQYHPDSSSGQADANRFSEIRDAYKRCMNYTKDVSMTRDIYAALDQELSDIDKHLGYAVIKQKRLAHRHYLSYDVGTGNVSQRQRSHSQQRVNQAMDNVFENQFQKALENPDAKEVAPYEGRKFPGKNSTKSLERIANEIIYDSIKRGEFDNLKGKGKPLKLEPDNPVLDNMEQRINKMLSNSGFAPEWISLGKDIQSSVDRLRNDLEMTWNKCGPHPMEHEHVKLWEYQLLQFRDSVDSINKKIFTFNLIVPSITMQRANVRLDRLLTKVMETNPTPHYHKEIDTDDVESGSEPDPLASLSVRMTNTVKQWYRHAVSGWGH